MCEGYGQLSVLSFTGNSETSHLLSGGMVGYIFIGVNKIFTTPQSHQFPPPPCYMTKTFMTPQPYPTLPLLPPHPSKLHTRAILPNLCPSDLNQTCMKHKEHLLFLFFLFNYSHRLMVCVYIFCTFFFFLTSIPSGI